MRSPSVQFRASPRLLCEIQRRADFSRHGGGSGSVAKADLERYYDLLLWGRSRLAGVFDADEAALLLRAWTEHRAVTTDTIYAVGDGALASTRDLAVKVLALDFAARAALHDALRCGDAATALGLGAAATEKTLNATNGKYHA